MLFRIFVPLGFLALWAYFRVSMRKRVFTLLRLNKSLIFFLDFLFLFIAFFRYFYKLQVPDFHSTAWPNLFMTGFFFMSIFLYVLTILVAWDVWELISTKFKKPLPPQSESDISRRDFLKGKMNLITLGAAGLGGATLGYLESQSPQVFRTDVPHASLPEEFDGLTIGQLSDCHVGPTIDGAFLKNACDKLMKEKPDIIAVTGDLVDGKPEILGSELRALKDLKAPLGVYFVTGNHEYYWGVNQWVKFLQDDIGMNVLQNENVLKNVKGKTLCIGGVNDYGAARFDKEHATSPEKAIEGAEYSAFKILLAHQPKSCFRAEKAGWNLQISGHTHAGQTFPFNIIVAIVQPYLKGLNWLHEMAVYVNQGTGYWGPPTRMGIPPEITLLTLKTNKKSIQDIS